ncbi:MULTISPECIES: hypothetical protein [unclassified Corallococcus]|uniref:hypothetical protein n=1 Tax=unclassified Corallococcus TaxID=2685029 RepID=UPI001A90C636|nr:MULTISPECIES: hypothetical protein [unclassified Corallococcus]MBN9683751.1 hypothetical protein [Corallococcus sp. NCSPR001]WAS89494.1 hypothetical protein O0N60_36440 [Corallococcus sp. NCRR]
MESWNQTSTDAVRTHAPSTMNRRIDVHVESCVRYMAEQGDRSEMSRYLEKLEHEWDVHRTLVVSVSGLALGGLLLGRKAGRGWGVLGGVTLTLLLQHGLTGFGPLSVLVRALGVRTRREIDLEKFAIKALRGDFERIPSDGGPLARANAALVAAQS